MNTDLFPNHMGSCDCFSSPNTLADKAGEEAEGYINEPDGDITAGSCQKYAAKPGAEKGSHLMRQKEDAHEGGHLAQCEVFTHQSCCR